jgi:hypothetical protein
MWTLMRVTTPRIQYQISMEFECPQLEDHQVMICIITEIHLSPLPNLNLTVWCGLTLYTIVCLYVWNVRHPGGLLGWHIWWLSPLPSSWTCQQDSELEWPPKFSPFNFKLSVKSRWKELWPFWWAARLTVADAKTRETWRWWWWGPGLCERDGTTQWQWKFCRLKLKLESYPASPHMDTDFDQ